MKFKTEVCLLSLALILFAVSAFFYSYQTGGKLANWASYPYQGYALAFVSFGSVLMVTASVSYSKRGKNMFNEDFDFSAEDKSN